MFVKLLAMLFSKQIATLRQSIKAWSGLLSYQAFFMGFLTLLSMSTSGCGSGEPALNSPRQVYDTYCFACHDTGAVGAPRLTDVEQWQARLKLGEPSLFANTLTGVRAMPKRGTCLACSDEELRATVAWMLLEVEQRAQPK